jgi:hypothetical protein
MEFAPLGDGTFELVILVSTQNLFKKTVALNRNSAKAYN